MDPSHNSSPASHGRLSGVLSLTAIVTGAVAVVTVLVAGTHAVSSPVPKAAPPAAPNVAAPSLAQAVTAPVAEATVNAAGRRAARFRPNTAPVAAPTAEETSRPTTEASPAAPPPNAAAATPAQVSTAFTSPTTTTQPVNGRRDLRALASIPGVTFGAEVTSDMSSGTAAMGQARALRTHSNLNVTVDLDSLVGWHGLSVFVQHKQKRGGNGSGQADFVQNFSNIDADDFRAFGEVYAQQQFWRERASIKAGRLDFNSDFAGTEHGAAFMNASMGFSPTITAAPTFPLPTTGVNAFVTVRERNSFGAGSFNGLDGAPAPRGGSSRFEIAQASRNITLGRQALAGRVSVGAWRHTGMFAASGSAGDEGTERRGTHGWYATADQRLWQGGRAGAAPGDSAVPADEAPSIGMFLQVGRADARVDAVQAHAGGGFVFAGLVPRRSEDVIGVGATRAAWNGDRETIGELFYRTSLLAHLALVGDVQRVRQSNGVTERRDGTVFTLRTIVSW